MGSTEQLSRLVFQPRIFQDVMERVLLLSKIESGLAQLDAGEGIPHEKVKQRLKRWLK